MTYWFNDPLTLFKAMSAVFDAKTSNSPSSDVSKNDRYDRQLRLWGDDGQLHLENSKVCLVNATATGTEILKSLVLPALGSFTIVDDNKVNDEDVSKNFFIDSASVGKSRAKVATQLLLEMNSDVRGDYVEESVESLLRTDPLFFKNFTVVIATSFWNEKTLVKLSELLWDENIPLLVCNSYGFIGYIRLQIPQHISIDSHPDNFLEDLRLDKPFSGMFFMFIICFHWSASNYLELKTFFEQNMDLETRSRKDIAHTPYLILLYKYLKQWQQEKGMSDDCLPSNYREKSELKSIINEAMKKLKTTKMSENEIERELELENFDEAMKAVNKMLVPSNYIPKETKQILEHSLVSDVIKKKTRNNQFWLLVKALVDFISNKNDGCLPLRGSIPDMTADSERYIKLQKIYVTKATEDVYSLQVCLQEACNTFGIPCEVSDNILKKFCKNAHCLRVVETSSIASEFCVNYETTNETMTKLRQTLSTSDLNGDGGNELIFYLMLRSVMRFVTLYNRFPGADEVEADINLLKCCFKELLNEFGFQNLSKDDFIHEMCRYGGCELSSVAAFIGGCAAHEVIKLIIGQYVPVNSTFIYNAMTSTTATYNW
ncbi:NEDD8-activating enzyme E1 regulatory subunit-like protein [Leptotrombidium deliense]|uniref:NEDD8-activating enzyme E1 regulatory subunit n=1 Tax=Leptotrombidium deliense TaxID=299467 RepID=A0A443SGL2_9ACAR|nr:NEDD8-activating enzyme E1 regulatory subunit-like protein [Leptotrombidium deliense]